MPLKVSWRLMFRVNDRVAADRCLADALGKVKASVSDPPKPYWKQPELWEMSLTGDFSPPTGDGVLSTLLAADALASGWHVSGPVLNDQTVSSFEGTFDLRTGRPHVAGLEWASFSVVADA